MSGRELDPDGTDSYHPEHPWEQVGHPQYLAPDERTSLNWPPEPAQPAGPHEAKQWRSLPARPRKPKADRETFGPGYTYPTREPHGGAGDSGARRPWWHRLAR
jgi:hypothetical protein